MNDGCQAHLPMQYASNLFAKGNSGVVTDSKEHLIRTSKTSLLFVPLAVCVHTGGSDFSILH